MDDIISILRMVERLLVVGFAGLSIFLGYRLFYNLPLEKDKIQKGSIELPGIKVVLSKVGPGIFFSVFGSLVLLQSLHEKIELTQKGAASITQKQTASQHFVGATEPVVPVNNSNSLASKRTAIKEQVGELNCSLKMLESLKPNQVTENMKIAFHEAKIALLKQVWDNDLWGNIKQLDSSDMGKINSIFYDTSVGCSYD